MTETNCSPVLSRQRPGIRNRRKHSLRTDMTPMVDLGFLLVTFFVFTSELSRPHTTNLVMPEEGRDMPVGESLSITVLLGRDNKVFYYEGNWDPATIQITNYSVKEGLGKLIREKQSRLDLHPVKGEGRTGLMMMIKPGSQASYKNVIDAMDETLINDVRKYAILKPGPEEKAFLEKQ